MNIKRTSRSNRKRQQIIDSASELFISKGYFETSMDDIAANADVSKQTVYAHFGSKDDLFTYCVEQKCSEVELAPFDLERSNDPKQQLQTFCMQVAQVIQSAEAIYVLRLCISQAETHPQLSRRFYAAGPGRVLQQLIDGLEQLNCLPDWHFDDPQIAAEQLMALTKGLAGFRLELGVSEETPSQRQQRIEAAVEMFCRAHYSG